MSTPMNEKEEFEHVEAHPIAKGDLNAEFYAQYGATRDIGQEENEVVRRRIDLYLLPMYVVLRKM